MVSTRACAICNRRKSERFCPAKGEKICAVCCGTEREVTLDCPSDCSFLIAAHRYEYEHRKPLARSEMPFPDVEFSPNVIHERETLLSGLAYTVLTFAANRPELTDADSLAAIKTLAETYRTLISGIYYEHPPDGQPANALYTALANFIQDYKKRENDQAGFSTLKDSQVFQVLVFLARMARNTTNGRPRARLFLNFLRRQFPQVQTPRAEASRIIMP